MSTVPQIYLPAELIHAVLIRVEEPDDKDETQVLKRGLASCSLTCRHWATSIRPLLFEELTLRSGEDISQLVAFLDADSLQPALSSCIRFINVAEGQASAGPPWSHQLMRIVQRTPFASICQWTVEGAPAVADNQHLPVRSPLPFAALPRTLPPSILRYIQLLTLSGLSLRSLRDLANFVGNHICKELVLDSVTFAEETADDIQLRRVPTPRSALMSIRVTHGLLDRDTILYWMKSCHILFASRDHERLDNSILELATDYLHLLLSHSGHQDQTRHLHLSKQIEDNGMCFHPLSEESLERC